MQFLGDLKFLVFFPKMQCLPYNITLRVKSICIINNYLAKFISSIKFKTNVYRLNYNHRETRSLVVLNVKSIKLISIMVFFSDHVR